jgi:EAL domain-containing protein (putative c-di-GMP-specific phosphodiesterase class I)
MEVTESAVMLDMARSLTVLNALHDQGIRLSIDDFGTGYSSMAYLKQLPVDELKIDRSFIIGMTSDHDDAVIVRGALDLGHNLGLTVVAEGVETEDHVSALSDLGCDMAQGYHYARPMPPDELTAWLAARSTMDSLAPQSSWAAAGGPAAR